VRPSFLWDCPPQPIVRMSVENFRFFFAATWLLRRRYTSLINPEGVAAYSPGLPSAATLGRSAHNVFSIYPEGVAVYSPGLPSAATLGRSAHNVFSIYPEGVAVYSPGLPSAATLGRSAHNVFSIYPEGVDE
jgi:hypothetical protein